MDKATKRASLGVLIFLALVVLPPVAWGIWLVFTTVFPRQ